MTPGLPEGQNQQNEYVLKGRVFKWLILYGWASQVSVSHWSEPGSGCTHRVGTKDPGDPWKATGHLFV